MKLEWLEPAANDAPATAEDLAAVGVVYEYREVDPAHFQPMLDTFMAARGYVTQDEVAMTADMPNFDELCDKFSGEHRHPDDEVRYVVEGEGIFDIRSKDDRWIRVTVTPGDMVIVPAGLYHRFFLTDTKTIRCVRLFTSPEGWVAHYRSDDERSASQ